ncbi:hypothetical protein K435DRAFT_789540 [Dendrothele bispora CBS 962.96]|uniref:NAD(P)-binding protein n=1 Tax=Dendrothele bispora (strain CBS 962.96) TaxID=1314807 RepID=A0A4S8MTM3_DENBC|nr:hypothetical protein K435DRAFT_789540 [Dendrothele bispora CBS 962.96]
MSTTSVDLLILGAGWTSSFLIPLCEERHVSYAATSRSGANSTIKFEFDQGSDNPEPFKALPDAKSVLITFPITVSGASERLVQLYKSTRHGGDDTNPGFIQLGATSIWGVSSRQNARADPQAPLKPVENKWYDRKSPFVPGDRVNAEEELLKLSPSVPTTVLDLAGLWGGSRSMMNYVGRVAPTKEILKNKGSIHMIHGIDVARAILAVHGDWSKASGERWLLTDGRVYDWWDLASSWGSGPDPTNRDSKDRGPQPVWVRELMKEEGVRALPRNIEVLGRALDSREFWETFGLDPIRARLE